MLSDPNPKLRVAYVVNHAPMYGANWSLLNLVDGLSEQEDIKPFFVLAEQGQLCDMLDQRSIPYRIIPHDFSIYPVHLRNLRDIALFLPRLARSLRKNLAATRETIQAIGGFAPHLVHTNIGPDSVGFAAARALSLPHVWHLREYQDLDFRLRYFPRKSSFIRKLNHPNNSTIAITQGIRDHFPDAKRVQVIENGVLWERDAEIHPDKNEDFLFVGRIEPNKGIDFLLDAFEEFHRTSHHSSRLVIAGDGVGSYVGALKERHRSIAAHLDFRGFVDAAEVRRLMVKAKALVVPSVFEGFGRITAEAMFRGCLVLGRRTGGTREILERSATGRLFETPADLVRLLQETSEVRYEQMEESLVRAREFARKNYSIEANAWKIRSVYLDLLQSPVSKPPYGDPS